MKYSSSSIAYHNGVEKIELLGILDTIEKRGEFKELTTAGIVKTQRS